jgi:hypothetical protein
MLERERAWMGESVMEYAKRENSCSVPNLLMRSKYWTIALPLS